MAGTFVETFDNGVGALNHVWGNARIDTSTKGEVTITGPGGFMQRPHSESAGHGYGTYSVVASIEGNAKGPAALLWPGDDVWPGPEYDILEVINGKPYGTVHYKGGDGGDGYSSVFYEGIDESKVHTYTLDWQPGSITYAVDGKTMGTITKNVGADHAHGGVNEVFGLMNTNWHTSMTVYEVSYTPMGQDSGAAPSANAAPDSAVAGTEAIDWHALAAIATANYEATGMWFI
ncbi:family 16 glycosylhydrolase [Belnapia rosea]|uniref:family 16 glycosylhydrolase n=1 Tax=Belnapia rosea TaxID=938405 RepID=UPI000883FF38|nr:family 16 glycosylhydrolase [Belnapia rosea]SDB69703.1 Glycosyl hydrolases family 16 [Belnapia rosea]